MSEIKPHEWQQRSLGILDDVDILEVIAPKRSGKSELGRMFLNEGTTKIVITSVKNSYKDSFTGSPNDIHIVNTFEQMNRLRGIKLENVHVLIDEMFMTDVRMSHLDKILGTNYKLLAIGTKTKQEDTFMIPFSKKLLVTAFATDNTNGDLWLEADANSFELGTNGYYEVM